MFRHLYKYPKTFFALALALFLLCSWYFSIDLLRLYRGGPLDPTQRQSLPPLSTEHTGGKHGPGDTSAIKPWMTFEYLNTTFSLPEDYLKNVLTVNDSEYPKMDVGKAAYEAGMYPREYIERVGTAILQYRHANRLVE